MEIECHFCLRMFEESHIRWMKGLGQASQAGPGEPIEFNSVVSDTDPDDGSVPTCLSYFNEMTRSSET
jgi:hypothetical protein